MTSPDRSIVALAALVDRAAQVHRVAAARALHEQGVPEGLAGLLWVLGRDDTGLGMREIARALGCDPSNVTQLTERLEQQGLATRVPDPADRRRRVPRLTRAGEAVARRLVTAIEDDSPLAALTVDEQSRLAEALSRGLGD